MQTSCLRASPHINMRRKPPPYSITRKGKALYVVIFFHISHMRVFALMLWGKRYSRIVAFSIGEGGPRQWRSGTFVNCLLETISPALFHPAFPIQPPPLRGTSFHRKEGASTRAPSLGRGCRAQRGGVGFLLGRRSRLLFAFPIEEVFAGKTVFSFLHPSHAKTAVSYERPFLCVLLA